MEPTTAQPLQQVDDVPVAGNQELEGLLSSLPKERGIISPHSYQYQGFWYSPLALQGVLNCQKHFQPRENDLFLVTAPKSGTTWLKAILYALMNREAHPPQNPHHPLLNKTPHQLVPFFELLDPSEYDSVCNSSDSSTRIFATHIPVGSLPKSLTDDCKIVYLCRDIKDNFVSLFHFANKVNMRPCPISLEEALDLYCNGISAVGQIWDQIIRLCSFETMSKLEVNKTGHLKHWISNSSFFGNGIVGDGKKYLTADMASRLDRITENKFHGSGLSL